MALLPYRECKKEVSEYARSCPDCGAPFPVKKVWRGTGIDWKSKTTVYDYPLVHIAFGPNAIGRLRVTKGIIAIGQFAIGVVVITQFGIGIIFGFGQFIFGLTAVAQVAVAKIFGCGQSATGYITIGQLVIAYYGLAQTGFAKYLWCARRKDPEAAEIFRLLAEKIGLSLNKYLTS